jgi:hypothetical protein
VTLERVRRFHLPKQIVASTEESLRRAGVDGFESFVLWTGRVDDDVFQVCTAHVPKQRSYKTRSGLCVEVEGEALHKLNVWLYEHAEVLGGQVHAHPTRAYHSKTDDAFPMVTTFGGLSLVVPDFCRAGLFERSAVYRYTRDERWAPVAGPIDELLTVV